MICKRLCSNHAVCLLLNHPHFCFITKSGGHQNKSNISSLDDGNPEGFRWIRTNLSARHSSNMVDRKAEIVTPCLKIEGEIVKGFQRGSREIGCPTANFNQEIVTERLPKTFSNGIYFGWSKLDGTSETVEKAVISVGWNPYYKNEKKSVETHILKDFGNCDLYGRWLKLVICGYIRPELDFAALDDLVSAIKEDIAFAQLHLDESDGFRKLKDDEFLKD